MSKPGDFIEVYPNALAPALCEQLIQRFNASGASHPGRIGGGVYPELKNSRDITLQGKPEWADAEQQLNSALFACLLRYVRHYGFSLIAPLMLQFQPPGETLARRITLDDMQSLPDEQLATLIGTCFRPGSINLQHYRAGEGGYPYWHCELYPKDPSCEPLHRHLLWTVYLNDDFNHGETEFYYQQRKIKPQKGALLIAPTAFTHTHRGNRPENGDKYIATSWVLFQRAEKLFGQPAR
ncbi:2OG-Fe(II) oxygenase [Pseudomarimonas arenosa]|uniref:2OG-Fe(II) oxygenase n=1 Tax=Pseudomarimonas arenosa TaxID=2774145 RepID=A0AAW3ZMD5_9GAMM|nr:2OG-Fe(II) oxygenase [Pseudomarimonas arenosa]MBD8526347.1 2OG-Fe(II) oxygenase [Pseudomarimonas arenosa]